MAVKRGAFIVFEGLDRSGKSTQVARLVEKLNEQNRSAVSCRFPDRTTSTGKMIDAYLTRQSDLDDHAIHLLFSANRWERVQQIKRDLAEGKTVVCDRYAFSGIAFTAVKGIPFSWCKNPDIGLPAPDAVFFLDVTPSSAESRGGYGNERYETRQFQEKVEQAFNEVRDSVVSNSATKDIWHSIDANKDIDSVTASIMQIIDPLLETIATKPISLLWVDQ